MSEGDTTPDEQLIQTATYRLVDALDEVLDIDAGLTDATRSRLPRTVADALEGSLDVDAGLAHIMSPARPKKPAVRPVRRTVRRRRWRWIYRGLLTVASISAVWMFTRSPTIILFLLIPVLAMTFFVREVSTEARRRNEGLDRTAGLVSRVRGPIRGQLENGVTTQCVEITVEYYTRRGEGPFEVQRLIPLAAASSYVKNERVIVSYDIGAPRRSRITGRLSHWPSTTRLGIGHSFGPDTRD